MSALPIPTAIPVHKGGRKAGEGRKPNGSALSPGEIDAVYCFALARALDLAGLMELYRRANNGGGAQAIEDFSARLKQLSAEHEHRKAERKRKALEAAAAEKGSVAYGHVRYGGS